MSEYEEGYCEACENFAQLHEHNGQMLCAECLELQGEEVNEDEDFM